MSRRTPPAGRAWDDFRAACAPLTSSRTTSPRSSTRGGHYDVPLDEEFPFAIRSFHYTSRQHTRGSTWHERLELFVPLDDRTLFRMGDQHVDLAAGRPARGRQPEAPSRGRFSGLRHPGASWSASGPSSSTASGRPRYDYTFLAAVLLAQRSPGPRPARCPHAPEAATRCSGSSSAWFAGEADVPLQRAGCRAFLLELLLELARRFRTPEPQQWEFLRQQQRSLPPEAALRSRQRALCRDRLTVAPRRRDRRHEPAAVHEDLQEGRGDDAGGLSEPRAAGQRLAPATRDQPDASPRSPARSASADQSYFDKRFKRAFGRRPRTFRTGAAGSKSSKNLT